MDRRRFKVKTVRYGGIGVRRDRGVEQEGKWWRKEDVNGFSPLARPVIPSGTPRPPGGPRGPSTDSNDICSAPTLISLQPGTRAGLSRDSEAFGGSLSM